MVLTNSWGVRLLSVDCRLTVNSEEPLQVDAHQVLINDLGLWLETVHIRPGTATQLPNAVIRESLPKGFDFDYLVIKILSSTSTHLVYVFNGFDWEAPFLL